MSARDRVQRALSVLAEDASPAAVRAVVDLALMPPEPTRQDVIVTVGSGDDLTVFLRVHRPVGGQWWRALYGADPHNVGDWRYVCSFGTPVELGPVARLREVLDHAFPASIGDDTVNLIRTNILKGMGLL